MTPYKDREKQKAYMRNYQQKQRELLKQVFTCKVCGEPKAGQAQRSPEKGICINCYVKRDKKEKQKQ